MTSPSDGSPPPPPRPCRSCAPFAELLGPTRPAPRRLDWDAVCDAVVCITTRAARERRWTHLKAALEAADLARRCTLLLNERACDLEGRDCDRLDACFASHLYVIQQAAAAGQRRVLILEDDVYFDVPALPGALRACSRFLRTRRPFSAFLFGGVYTEMKATSVPGVFSGRGTQAHAWLVDVQHPVWAGALASDHRMPDVFNHEHGTTFLLHPDVAFQRSFAAGEATADRPVYNLAELPPLHQALTKLGLRFGMRNCWEGCARRTNSLVRATGSIRVALIVLGVLVGLLSGAVVALACSWWAWAHRGREAAMAARLKDPEPADLAALVRVPTTASSAPHAACMNLS